MADQIKAATPREMAIAQAVRQACVSAIEDKGDRVSISTVRRAVGHINLTDIIATVEPAAAPAVPAVDAPGFVQVPVDAYLWLMGMGEDSFTEDRRGAYWWREAFNERAGLDMMAISQANKSALATPSTVPDEQKQQSQPSCNAALHAAPASQHDASSAATDQVMADLMPKRTAFLAWCKDRALDVSEGKDVWSRRKFVHAHIQSLWEGWFNAPATYATPEQPSTAGSAKGGNTFGKDSKFIALLSAFHDCPDDGEAWTDAEQAFINYLDSSNSLAHPADAGAVAVEQRNQWQPIGTLPYADDLVWLKHGDTVDGPRSMETDDYDRWSEWAPCTWPLDNVDAALPVARQPQATPLEAQWPRKDFIEQIVLGVAEMDRDSPEDQPEMMLVTTEELRNIVVGAFEVADENGGLEGCSVTPLEATSEQDEPTDREALIACLGDDAAQLDSMELWPEMAQTMREAAAMLESGEQMGGAQVAQDREQRAQELDDRYRKGYSEGWTEGRSNLAESTAADLDKLKKYRCSSTGMAAAPTGNYYFIADVRAILANRAAEGEATSERGPNRQKFEEAARARGHVDSSRTQSGCYRDDFLQDAWKLAVAATEATSERKPLTDLLTRIDDAWNNYERMGEVCQFEGQPMIYASTLEEIHALSQHHGIGSDK